VYGPVRTVVRQGSVGNRRPYADQVGECGAIQGLAPTSPENPHFVEMERPPLYTRVRGIF
jgi:hypothetical protein